MGHGYNFTCPNCKSSLSFLEGTGYCHPSHFKSLLSGENSELRETIPDEIWYTCENLIKDGWKLKDYTYLVCFCPDCKTLEQCTILILEKDGKTRTTEYTCTCGTKLQPCNPLELNIPFTITCEECKTKFTAKPNPCLCCWD